MKREFIKQEIQKVNQTLKNNPYSTKEGLTFFLKLTLGRVKNLKR